VFTDAALVDQVKSLDWIARKARYKGKVWTAELREVRADLR
jgi:mRNA interferase MazF